MNEKTAGKSDHTHARWERHLRPWHAKTDERTVHNPDVFRNRLQDTDRRVGFSGFAGQSVSLLENDDPLRMPSGYGGGLTRSCSAAVQLPTIETHQPSASSCRQRVSFCAPAVVGIPQIVIVQGVEREIVFAEFQIAENKQVTTVTQVT